MSQMMFERACREDDKGRSKRARGGSRRCSASGACALYTMQTEAAEATKAIRMGRGPQEDR